MPELPEVETLVPVLRPHVVGRTIREVDVRRPSALKPQLADEFVRRVRGRRIVEVRRRAKNLLLDLDNAQFVRVHLRMTGHLYPDLGVEPVPATARLYLTLKGGGGIVLDDPRTLGRVHVHAAADEAVLFADLGLEPLDAAFTAERFAALARRAARPVKLFLLDQTQVAGLGNIWAAEALHAAGIHPARPARSLSPVRVLRLHGAIVAVLQAAVQSAVAAVQKPSDFPDVDLLAAAVYGREGEPCRRCGRTIRRVPQGGRSTYYCPGCQR